MPNPLLSCQYVHPLTFSEIVYFKYRSSKITHWLQRYHWFAPYGSHILFCSKWWSEALKYREIITILGNYWDFNMTMPACLCEDATCTCQCQCQCTRCVCVCMLQTSPILSNHLRLFSGCNALNSSFDMCVWVCKLNLNGNKISELLRIYFIAIKRMEWFHEHD